MAAIKCRKKSIIEVCQAVIKSVVIPDFVMFVVVTFFF